MRLKADVGHALPEAALDWNDLRHLLVLRDCGNIAGAARRLKVDQATVRRRLAALQKAAGVALVVKVPGGLVLTIAGARAVEAARAMDASATQLEASLAALDSSLAGAVRIAAPDTLATWVLAPALGELHSLHPELTVELAAGAQAPDDLVRDVRPVEVARVEVIDPERHAFPEHGETAASASRGGPQTPGPASCMPP
jgi:DNA-binding transcriptional LysR family regulator